MSILLPLITHHDDSSLPLLWHLVRSLSSPAVRPPAPSDDPQPWSFQTRSSKSDLHHDLKDDQSGTFGAPEFWRCRPWFNKIRRKSSSWCWFLRLKQITYILEGAPEFCAWAFEREAFVPRRQKSGAPQEYNNLFVLISKAIIRIFVFSLFLNFFICPWYFLILLKHCQHKQDGNKEKRPKNRLGTGALVPQCSWLMILNRASKSWSRTVYKDDLFKHYPRQSTKSSKSVMTNNNSSHKYSLHNNLYSKMHSLIHSSFSKAIAVYDTAGRNGWH